ncbi:hypothetical protein [Streptomyces sp. P9-A2]|uniref:hypothetical protein n=1 Tax=Streptomyces sp. P9-A2 TaxID=3072284 RepID=UPI002FCA1FA2
MDPYLLTLAGTAGTALVGLLVGEGWQRTRDGVVAVWRRFRPGAAEEVGREPEASRAAVLDACEGGGTDPAGRLEGQRGDAVVRELTRAVGEWAARCRELEEQVDHARAEGRAEARAEFAERLRDAELRVARVLKEAEEERTRLEVELARAQGEPAARRQAVEGERETASVRDPLDLAWEWQGAEDAPVLLKTFVTGTRVFREQLRQLGMVAD